MSDQEKKEYMICAYNSTADFFEKRKLRLKTKDEDTLYEDKESPKPEDKESPTPEDKESPTPEDKDSPTPEDREIHLHI